VGDRSRGNLAAVLVTAALLVTPACASGGAAVPEAEHTWTATTLEEPYEPAQAALEDTDGAPFSLTADTDAPVTLVFFGYTHCPDICQMVMSTLAAAELRLPEEQRDQVDVVLVSTDPERDTGPVLREYLDRFDPSFRGARGPVEDTRRLARSLAVYFEPGPTLPSGGYEVAHNDHVLALTTDDRVPMLWMRDVAAADLAADLSALLEEES
jgi:protein SCO1/2